VIACSDSCRYHGVKAMVVTERCRLTGLIMGFIDQPSSAMGQPRQFGGRSPEFRRLVLSAIPPAGLDVSVLGQLAPAPLLLGNALAVVPRR
jgi:hypothetical protein